MNNVKLKDLDVKEEKKYVDLGTAAVITSYKTVDGEVDVGTIRIV